MCEIDSWTLENAWPLQVVAELQAAGLNPEAISGIMAAMQVRSLEDLQQLLGDDTPAVQQLQCLFRLAEGYGFKTGWCLMRPL